MKVALIVPDTRNSRTTNNFREVPLITPPLNLMYLAQAIIDIGHDATIIDSYLENYSLQDIISKCKRYLPDMFLIPLYSTDLEETYKIMKTLKETFPSVLLIAGGPHPSHMPLRTMQEFPMIDIVIKGEGERIIQKIVDTIDKKKSLKEIPSITYRTKKGIYDNPYKSSIKDLDGISIPDRSLIKANKYYSRMSRRNPIDVIITSRGCPYQCTFCAKISDDFKGYRVRSVDNVMDEIKHVYDKGAKALEIYDECFTVKKDRCHTILNRIREEKIDMEFRIRTRVNTIDRPLLQNLKKTGCSIISYGVESGNQQVLDINKKRTRIPTIRRAFKLTHKAGIASMGFFLVGLEGDTPQTIQQTVNFAKQLNPHYATFGHVIPYPGTEMYHRAKANDTLVGDWHRNRPMPYVKLPWLHSKQQALDMVSDAYRQFYYRPTYALHYMFRLLKRRNFNQLRYSIQNIRTNLSEINGVVVNEENQSE